MEDNKEVIQKIEALLAEGRRAIDEARSYLINQGEVVDLSEWVTIKEYCKRFQIKNIENRLKLDQQGIVPKENVMVIEEFNNTKLIKAIRYQVGF